MEIDGTLLTILGVSAGVLILTGWIEQIYKGYKTKSLKDVSKFLMLFIAAGSIIGTNTAGLILMIIVSSMKKVYDNRLKKSN